MLVRNGVQLEIPRRNSSCVAGNENLSPGSSYYSVLSEDSEGYRREDYCCSCWDKKKNEAGLPTEGFYWKSQVPDKKEGQNWAHLKRAEKALTLLKQINGSDLLEEQQKAFVLALFLVRQRQMVLRKEVTNDSGDFTVYEIVGTEEVLLVKRIDLPSLEVAKIQQHLAQEFQGSHLKDPT